MQGGGGAFLRWPSIATGTLTEALIGVDGSVVPAWSSGGFGRRETSVTPKGVELVLGLKASCCCSDGVVGMDARDRVGVGLCGNETVMSFLSMLVGSRDEVPSSSLSTWCVLMW